jgi:hypothetical protein
MISSNVYKNGGNSRTSEWKWPYSLNVNGNMHILLTDSVGYSMVNGHINLKKESKINSHITHPKKSRCMLLRWNCFLDLKNKRPFVSHKVHPLYRPTSPILTISCVLSEPEMVSLRNKTTNKLKCFFLFALLRCYKTTLGLCGTGPLVGPLSIPQMMWVNTEQGWNDTDRRKPKDAENNLP